MKANEKDQMIQEMQEMKNNGYSLQKIGEKFGCSRQYVHQLLAPKTNVYKFRELEEKDCVFPGLRRWLNSNRVGVPQLSVMMMGDYCTQNIKRLKQRLQGTLQLKKFEIDKLIDITNLTYEELFY